MGSAEPPLCPNCGRGRLVLVDMWPRASGRPWCSPVSQCVVRDRLMENTFEEYNVPQDMTYQMCEFGIKDPNGYALILGEDIAKK